MQSRLYFTIILVSIFNLLQAQVYPDSLYDDDHDQKFPLGFEAPEYEQIAPAGDNFSKTRVEPPFWWVGMKRKQLQILIYDDEIKGGEVAINYPGILLKDIKQVENPNYLFLELEIDNTAQPGTFQIIVEKDGEALAYNYELKERKEGSAARKGIDASDLIYLVMPDRFANGDYNNDSFDDMNQWGINREKPLFRHGGDILGVMEHMDYIEQLGVTALWLNPVLENDEPFESYHGYAITNHYEVDKRMGNNQQYKVLVELCHERGIQVIKDVVYNHVGDKHWFIEDLPDRDWIHQFDDYTKTSYRAPTIMDPYAAEVDKTIMTDGWFDIHMPDLNQRHPLLATYLIQNSIWWIEYADLDGFRIDTYAYADQEFMAELGKRLQEEYPDFSFFGETWVHGSPIQAQFTQNNNLRAGYNSYLPGVTDFQIYYAILDALNNPQGWTGGITKVYYTVAKDFLYEAPYRNVIFLDNHDLGRFYSLVEGDMEKFKSGIAFLMTTRGIPMLYYGTEILLSGVGGAFGEAGRKDFPGGWENDLVYKFNTNFLDEQEQEAFEYIKRLANYRKETPALHDGKLKQFIPENGIYAYFREGKDEKVMVIMNMSEKAQNAHTARFREELAGYTKARNIISGQMLSNLDEISLEARQTLILELEK